MEFVKGKTYRFELKETTIEGKFIGHKDTWAGHWVEVSSMNGVHEETLAINLSFVATVYQYENLKYHNHLNSNKR